MAYKSDSLDKRIGKYQLIKEMQSNVFAYCRKSHLTTTAYSTSYTFVSSTDMDIIS